MKKLLVVVDMQKDFIDGALGTKEAIAILPTVEAKIKAHNGMVIFTKDTHGEDYLQTQEGKNLPVLHCVKDTVGWALAPSLEAAAKELQADVFEKPSFGSVELASYISDLYKKKDIESVELIGLCTDICVISNAMLIKAFVPELFVSVDAACCAGVTPKSHDNALSAMKMCQIAIENA